VHSFTVFTLINVKAAINELFLKYYDISGNKDYRKYEKYDNMPAVGFPLIVYIASYFQIVTTNS